LETVGCGFLKHDKYAETAGETFASFNELIMNKTRSESPSPYINAQTKIPAAIPKREIDWVIPKNNSHFPILYPKLPQRDDEDKDHNLENTKTLMRNFVTKVWGKLHQKDNNILSIPSL
jgi:hypothetical protein